MGTMASPSVMSLHKDASTFDELSMRQSLLFSDSLKDLKNLRAQLYSAAEYFELSYTDDDQKQIVVNTLKDYAIQALVNTIDHLGSVTFKVNSLLDEQVDEVSETELRVSCIEQRLRTCQEYSNCEGISQQSLVITTPKYHKRYILPVEESINGPGYGVKSYQGFDLDDEDYDWHQLRSAIQATIRETPPSSFRKTRSQSPSPRRGTFFFTEKRAVSPAPGPRPLSRSGSFSSRPTTPNSSNRRHPQEPSKSASSRQLAERDGRKELEQYPSKSKRLFKALLSRRRSSNKDQMLYSYLDEY
ncbi:protein ABIL3-like protein [Cinnamomum micranthum f. kanehirae]|uniref:Protein ABIL3-like protein n=1 Tax=Cinnamomum micranthum f. kanehirae TaxID=337451 RepID=A0A3S3NQ07_9MAGN|nr:protein ABIL3-like protein [Cinnamomum micranthum f. kanehirae]